MGTTLVVLYDLKGHKLTMAMPMHQGGGPQWANPEPNRSDAIMQEEEFFAPLSTLDEPVMETIMRDVHAVASKLKIVMLPMERNVPYGGYAGVSQTENVEVTDRDKEIIQRLKDWDLWGPLVVCLGLAVLLSFKAPEGQASLVFAAVFCAVWVGSAVVTVNAQLLGGTISFFQSLIKLGAFSTLVELAVLVVAFLWATRASSVSNHADTD
eukprot:scaffold15472_cov117-Cylindrotheca_fusiformis.AAC.21